MTGCRANVRATRPERDLGATTGSAAALMLLSALVTSSALAEQPYEPPISIERVVGQSHRQCGWELPPNLRGNLFELRLHRQLPVRALNAFLTPAVGRPSNLSKHGSSNQTEPK